MDVPTPVTQDDFDPSRGRYIRAAIKRQAMKVSIEDRQGRFSRVSEDFIKQIEAIAETKIRELDGAKCTGRTCEVPLPDGVTFLTGDGKARLVAAFNKWLAVQVHREINKVMNGKTL